MFSNPLEPKNLNPGVDCSCFWGEAYVDDEGNCHCREHGSQSFDEPRGELMRVTAAEFPRWPPGSQECRAGYQLVTANDGRFCVRVQPSSAPRSAPVDTYGLPIGDDNPGDPEGGVSRVNWRDWYQLHDAREPQPQTATPTTPAASPKSQTAAPATIFGLSPIVALAIAAGGVFLLSQMSGDVTPTKGR